MNIQEVRVQDRLQDLSGIGSGVMVWGVGTVSEVPWLQVVGAVVGVGMLAVAISREIREWRRKK